ncbi:MAG: threonine synthase [Synergistota bacterium]|nr:threonine synthase [Synergistota bacterium]
MGKAVKLECAICGKTYDPDPEFTTCPDCGIDGTMHVLYDYEEIGETMTAESLARDPNRSLWRYLPLLPVSDVDTIPALQVGWTPLYDSGALAERYGVGRLLVKDDGRNPTASYKDRASAVAAAMAKELGRDVVACASTGNAASSLSGFAAVSGLKSVIFVPEAAPEAKVTQLLVYGSRVFSVRGDYEETVNLAIEAIDSEGWYNRNCAINPYLVEGKKTCAMEIAEQMDWKVPDRVITSVGDGCIISSLYKGFLDLKRIGLIDRIPAITGVQAEGACPVHDAVRSGADRVTFGPADTVADSISVGAPRNWVKALNAVRSSGGTTVTVSDQEILEAMTELARATGVFGEPAGVTSFAGFKKMANQGTLGSDEVVAIVVTGNGLKDAASARKAVEAPTSVDPSMESLLKVLKR